MPKLPYAIWLCVVWLKNLSCRKIYWNSTAKKFHRNHLFDCITSIFWTRTIDDHQQSSRAVNQATIRLWNKLYVSGIRCSIKVHSDTIMQIVAPLEPRVLPNSRHLYPESMKIPQNSHWAINNGLMESRGARSSGIFATSIYLYTYMNIHSGNLLLNGGQ